MTGEAFSRAREILQTLETIKDLKVALYVPYPIISGGKDVCLATVDDKTNELIKNSIREVLDKREKELREEFEQL